MMRLSVTALGILLATVGLSPGCASGTKSPDYSSEYSLDGLPRMRGSEFEAVFADAVAGTETDFDRPIRVLQAPQPIMSVGDIAAGVVGQVVVYIQFGETGNAERWRIARSTKDSLAEAVLAVVSRWQIEPATRDGKAVRVVVRQPFAFKTGSR